MKSTAAPPDHNSYQWDAAKGPEAIAQGDRMRGSA